MRNFASIMLPFFSSLCLFAAIFLNIGDYQFLGIELDVFLGSLGAFGFVLSVLNFIIAAVRYRRRQYPQIRLWAKSLLHENDEKHLLFEANAEGFGTVPDLMDFKVFIDGMGLRNLWAIGEPTIKASGKIHTYDFGQWPDGADGKRIHCFAFSLTTMKGYFSKEFPKTHRIYKIRRRYRPAHALEEVESHSPNRQIERAMLIDFDTPLLWREWPLKIWKRLRRQQFILTDEMKSPHLGDEIKKEPLFTKV